MGAVLTPWGFDECDEMIYRAVLRRPGVTVDVLAAELDVPIDDVLRAARKLIRGRLIRRRGDGVAGLRPDVALAGLVRDAEAQLGRRRGELDDMESAVAQFVHDHVLGEQDHGAPPGVDVVTGWDEVDRVVGELAGTGVADVARIVRPPLGAVADLGPGRLPGDLRPARTRTLCTPDLLDRDGPGRQVVETARAVGAVRVAARLPMKMMLVHGRAALLPLDWERQRADEVLVVRSPALLGALASMFEMLWERAVPLGRGGAEADGDALLELLAGGLQDEAVADRLGVSVRTVRRRVADLLEELGARTRFQAGVLAARKGLL